jgi:hypothetical protein
MRIRWYGQRFDETTLNGSREKRDSCQLEGYLEGSVAECGYAADGGAGSTTRYAWKLASSSVSITAVTTRAPPIPRFSQRPGCQSDSPETKGPRSLPFGSRSRNRKTTARRLATRERPVGGDVGDEIAVVCPAP